MDASVLAQIGTVIGGAVAAYLGTVRNRQKMGEVQAERQKPVLDNVETLHKKIDAKDRVIMEMSDRISAIERVTRRTEVAIKGGDMEPHTNPFAKSHSQLLADEAKRRNKK